MTQSHTPIPRHTSTPLLILGAVLAPLILSGCGGGSDADSAPDASLQAGTEQDAFMENLATLCGRAFRGSATLSSSTDFQDELVMHVRVCSPEEVQIPLHVGENRSRTWIITRTAEGLRLKHDHRLPDGSDDPVTQYGGDTATQGTALSQSFPADAFTAELIPEAATNVWSMTLVPGESFTYHLTRHGEPRATFVIDLTDEVPLPPAPWGYEDR